jgi:serine/threonine protein kinase
MQGVTWHQMDHLPSHHSLGLDGAHGRIVAFEGDGENTVAKVVSKTPGRGVPMEYLSEMIVRDRCGCTEDNRIVPITRVIETPYVYAMVMPYMRHGDLFHLLRRICDREEAPMAPAQLDRICKDLVTAVCAMHLNNIAHRDIKDSNVLLADGYDGAYLCDMSLSTSLSHEASDHFVPYTCGYRPPEVLQYAKDFADALDWYASDIYVTGSVIAKCLMVCSGWWSRESPPRLLDFSGFANTTKLDQNTRDLVISMMDPTPAFRPRAYELLQRIRVPHPDGLRLQQMRPAGLNGEISRMCHKLRLEEGLCQVASDVFSVICSSTFPDAHIRAVLALAFAVKSCYSSDECTLLKRFPEIRPHLAAFIEIAARSPEMIRACHTSIC